MVDRVMAEPGRTSTVLPNMPDYSRACAEFSWDRIRRELSGVPGGGGLNIAHEAVDRHAAGTQANRIALRWLGKDGRIRDFTYRDLKCETNQFANWLQHLGIGKGDRVFALAGRIPELHLAAMGTMKLGAIFCPLSPEFRPEPICERLRTGNARALITTERIYQTKIANILNRLPDLQHVILTDASVDHRTGVWSMAEGLRQGSSEFTIGRTDPEDWALLHFTSGTTGKPKGTVHVHNAVLAHYLTGKYVLDFHPEDIFWCTADPGWVTGTSYGVIAPLLHGITSVIDESGFDPERGLTILEDQQVTVWYTDPAAIRMLMRVGFEPRRRFDLRKLRLIASVGEPLSAEAVIWGQEALGLPIRDTWGQTETGGIMIANFPSMEIRPGSMGRPVPGTEAAIVRGADQQRVEAVEEPGVEGDLALEPCWPSMFRAYLDDEAHYQKCFTSGWYMTGDLARKDADGYYWFVGRADDMIKTAGHQVGPFEVESALMSHPDVSEAAVIGKPDPIVGEIVKAFVTLKPDVKPSEPLRFELLCYSRRKLGSAIAPQEIEFKESLPHTPSAQIIRRLLRARELGLPEGDVSTLETFH